MMRTATVALAAALALAALPGTAQQGMRDSGLVVHGEGRVAVAPDLATLSLGVTSEAGTAEEAMARNSDATADVLDELRDAGIAERDIQTSALTLSPRYDQPRPEAAARVTGYIAGNTVTVRVRDLPRLGEVLDAVVGEGANTIHGLSFDVAERQALAARARKRAVADAMRKAEQMAATAGVTLGPVRALVEEGGSGGVVRTEARMAAAASVPVAEGEVTVESTVRMVFGLGD